jgi:hypothetical protein
LNVRRHLAACWLALPALGGCYASNVVAEADRAVVVPVAQLEFAPATAAEVRGLFESLQIEGDAAFTLRKVWYWFAPDGSYAGAALQETADGMTFQTRNGTWRLDASGFALDDGGPAVLLAAPEHLRLETPGGALLLRRARLQ